METLSRTVMRGVAGATPLPPAFGSWEERGIRLRRATVTMLAGVPGSYKTTVALNVVANLKIPTLAFSTDSDRDTVAARLLGLSTRTATDITEEWLRLESERAVKGLEKFDFIQWDFCPNPSMDDVWLSTYAYLERWGVWPEQILIDICSDVGHDAGDEWSSLRDLMRQSKVLARETDAHVLLVHHASDSPATKRPCPRRSDIHGKIAAIPEVIITLGMDTRGDLRAACVKNRRAKADADADNHFLMALDAACAWVGDWIPMPHAFTFKGPVEEEGNWWQ